MKKALVFLLFFAALPVMAADYYNAVLIDTTTSKATLYHAGDILLYTDIDGSTTTFEVKAGTITRVSAIAWADGTVQISSPNISSIASSALDTSSITKQGNTFNGASQLLQLDASAYVPSANLDPSSVTMLGPSIETGELPTDIVIAGTMTATYVNADATPTGNPVPDPDFESGTAWSYYSIWTATGPINCNGGSGCAWAENYADYYLYVYFSTGGAAMASATHFTPAADSWTQESVTLSGDVIGQEVYLKGVVATSGQPWVFSATFTLTSTTISWYDAKIGGSSFIDDFTGLTVPAALGTSGAVVANNFQGAWKPKQKTTAQLEYMTEAEGTCYWCTDCTPTGIYCSTGTLGGFVSTTDMTTGN